MSVSKNVFNLINALATKKEANKYLNQLKKQLKTEGYTIKKINDNQFETYQNEQKISKYFIYIANNAK